MQISALQPQVTNADRINIFVDNRFLLAVHALVVLHMGLEVGQELTQEQLEQLQREEALQQAVDRALHYLSFRPRSREEVRRYLRRKETPSELIDEVMTRLDHLDLVNDRAFGTFWIETREQFSPRGARALKNELRLKGVERTVIDEIVSEEQDEERALRAARHKAIVLARQAGIDYGTFRNRLGSFLQRRGFSYEVTKRVVRALWQELVDNATDNEATDDF
jgi:regulatory protein